MGAPWKIELLGALRAEGGGRVVTRLRTRKTELLLGYLAYHLSRPHAREQLIELLWPECEPHAGRQSLSQALCALRQQLEPPGVPAGSVLMADRTFVQLNAAAVGTDVAEFQVTLQAAAGARGTERAELLARAVEQYRGELLSGHCEGWILVERECLLEALFQALGQLIASLEEAGDLQRAIQYAYQGVRADPLREDAYRELIRLLIRTGERAGALRQYRQMERLLAQEFGDTPAPATRALLSDLERLATAPAPPAGPPTAAGAEPLPRDAPPRLPDVRRAPPAARPTGTVTLLLTELEGVGASSAPPSQQPAHEPSASALAQYHALLRPLFPLYGGSEIQGEGTTVTVAFGRASDALTCALDGQRLLAAHPWPESGEPLPVRMALDTGEVDLRNGEYRGALPQHARQLVQAAHGGQILCSEETATLLRRDLMPGVWLVDLGVYRLHGGSQETRLFQVGFPERVRREFSPPNAEPGVSGNLPLPLTRFFNREAEIARLLELLGARAPRGGGRREDGAAAGVPRLVTLTGPGGTGKTRLALAVAGRLLDAWQGAVWFVPLADLADPRLIPDAIRDVLHLPNALGVAPRDQVAAFFSRQPALLLLDSFEHLVDEGASLVRSLLEQVPILTCLVTSRRRLGLTGEQEFPVPPLATPHEFDRPAGEDPALALSRCASVQLFVDRARAVRPDFRVTRANAAALATLCDRLEGIPLALELAAARALALTPAQLLAHLEKRFDFLVSREPGMPARHRTLRAALDGSYQLLAPYLRPFFARLSVFRRGWTLQAAEAVCQEPLSLDYLEELRECSLVFVELSVIRRRSFPTAAEGAVRTHDVPWEPPDGEAEVRFRMLETLRQYAREQLSPEELAAARRRHAEFFLALAERAERELRGPEQGVWLDRLEAEQFNLRAALRWLIVVGDAEAAYRLAGALWRFWYLRGHWEVARLRLSDVLALPLADRASSGSAPVANPHRARVLQGAGVLASEQGDYEAARALLGESLAIFRELGDRQGIATALHCLGDVLGYQGDDEAAQERLAESLAILRDIGDRRGTAGVLQSLGKVAHTRSDLDAARALFEESLALRRALGDQQEIAATLASLGDIAQAEGEYATARALLEESLVVQRELDDRQGIAGSLSGLGAVSRAQADYDAARAYFEESLEIKRALGDRRDIAWLLNNLGDLALCQGDSRAARSFYEESLAIERDLASPRRIAYSLHSLGQAARNQGDDITARALFEESLAIRQELRDGRGIAACLQGLGEVAQDQGDYEAARALFEESLAIRRESRDQHGIAGSLQCLGCLALSQGDVGSAGSLLDESMAIFRELDYRRGIVCSLRSMGEVAAARGEHDTAFRLYRESLAMLRQMRDLPGVIRVLECLANVAAARSGEPRGAWHERAARWLGAAAALRETLGAPLPPDRRSGHEAQLAAIRHTLGEAAFTAATSAGRAMSWEQAAAEALGEPA